jgi:hypothetical protein
VTHHLSASQIETLRRACELDTFVRTYRAIGVSESTLRLALDGNSVAQRTFEACRDFCARWQMEHPPKVCARCGCMAIGSCDACMKWKDGPPA